MSIYEAIGIAWTVFTSSLATIEILYLAFSGLRQLLTGKGVSELRVWEIADSVVQQDRKVKGQD